MPCARGNNVSTKSTQCMAIRHAEARNMTCATLRDTPDFLSVCKIINDQLWQRRDLSSITTVLHFFSLFFFFAGGWGGDTLPFRTR